ncbi:MAG: hypothetical protein AAGB11_12535 [Pseudomonadota bacterium]
MASTDCEAGVAESDKVFKAAASAVTSNVRLPANTAVPRFDRGRWCEYRKVKVYDAYHKETYFIDQEVCLGATRR